MDRRNKKNSITWNGDASEWFVEAITHIEIKKVVKWHNREKSFGHFGDADVGMPLRYNDYYQVWEPPFSYLRATLFSI